METHIKTSHHNPEKFQCDKCSKDFVLKWRLQKHAKIHTQESVEYCHYYNNDKPCPYEELGCKFLHEVANDCKFGKICNKEMCPRRHPEEKLENIGDIETDTVSTPQKINDQCEECENQPQCTDCYVRHYEETAII